MLHRSSFCTYEVFITWLPFNEMHNWTFNFYDFETCCCRRVSIPLFLLWFVLPLTREISLKDTESSMIKELKISIFKTTLHFCDHNLLNSKRSKQIFNVVGGSKNFRERGAVWTTFDSSTSSCRVNNTLWLKKSFYRDIEIEILISRKNFLYGHLLKTFFPILSILK